MDDIHRIRRSLKLKRGAIVARSGNSTDEISAEMMRGVVVPLRRREPTASRDHTAVAPSEWSPLHELDSHRWTLSLVPHLTGSALKVVLFIHAHVAKLRKATVTFTLAQIEHGTTKANGTPMLCGTGLNVRDIRRAVSFLENLFGADGEPLLRRVKHRDFTEYALHLGWSANAMAPKPPVPKRLQNFAGTSMGGSMNGGFEEDILSAQTGQNSRSDRTNCPPLLVPSYMNLQHEPTCSGSASGEPAHGFFPEQEKEKIYRVRTRPTTAVPPDFRAPPATSEPELPFAEAGPAQSAKPTKPASIGTGRDSGFSDRPTGFFDVWSAAMRESYVGPGAAPVMAWGVKDHAQAKTLFKSWRRDMRLPSDEREKAAAQDFRRFLDFVVRNWVAICHSPHGFRKTRIVPPPAPTIGFVLSFSDRLASAYLSEDLWKWLTAVDRSAYERLRVTGYSHDGALAKLGEEAAIVKMREENATMLARAQMRLRIADQMERDAASATRFTKDNPHPRSLRAMQNAAKTHAVQEPRAKPDADDVDWDGLVDQLPRFEDIDG